MKGQRQHKDSVRYCLLLMLRRGTGSAGVEENVQGLLEVHPTILRVTEKRLFMPFLLLFPFLK